MKSRNRFKALMVIIVIAAVASAICVVAKKSFFKRSPFGHIIRRIQGETGAQQIVNDLAEDLRGKPLINQIQQWSLDTMDRVDSRKIILSHNRPNWPVRAVVVVSNEVPNFIKNYRPSEPEVAVAISTNTNAECVIIDWYEYGIIVGRTNQEGPFFNIYDELYNGRIKPLYSVRVQPGVFVIWLDNN